MQSLLKAAWQCLKKKIIWQFLDLYPKELKAAFGKPFAPILMALLLTMGGTWEPPNCSLTGEWISKMWHTREHYSASKRKAILPHATTWMDELGGCDAQ